MRTVSKNGFDVTTHFISRHKTIDCNNALWKGTALLCWVHLAHMERRQLKQRLMLMGQDKDKKNPLDGEHKAVL
ncbi:hypothetical protein TNCV_1023151 [Trichonephila clavipes]|nr:hypothetical protein TNCV_1023151 [Trichonephila clavipes]